MAQDGVKGLKPHVSRFGIWALSLGTSIGWGSLVVTSNSYLLQAGPQGSVIGILIGMAVMLIIARNYSYLINLYPDAGGAYRYAKETFGYDYGFVTAWFLGLTYIAVFWANATSLPLFARYFFGNYFRIGYLYTIFGYKVYLGEVLLTIAAILLFASICMKSRHLSMAILTALVVVFTAGILICFIAAIRGHGTSGMSFNPAFIPESKKLSQAITVACISPWAFIGFENVSHLSEEYKFPHKRIFSVMVSAVVVTTVLYVAVLLLSVTAYPSEYATWLDYIKDLGNLSGIKGLPAFYAAQYYLGSKGVMILVASLFALIVTSLIGNMTALSRLLYALGKDRVMPASIGRVNRHNVPAHAMEAVALISLIIPFLGRTAIGWIVDVTTIGATIVYGFVSASARRAAREHADRIEKVTGLFGVILMVLIAAYILLPNFVTTGSMAKETYILFVIWGVLGFIVFRGILRRDYAGRFGRSLVVWISTLSMVLFIALIWMNQSLMEATDQTMARIHEHYIQTEEMTERDVENEQFIQEQMKALERSNTRAIGVVAGLFVFSLAVMLTNYSYMNKRRQESEIKLGRAQKQVNTDPLTGVKSKHAYVEQESELNEKIAEKQADPFALVICDVNGLKTINDTQGHKAGDEYICAASELICHLFTHSPVFRVGGDEFTVLLTGHDFEARHEIISELHRRSEENIGLKKVVVAAGLSDYDPDQDQNVQDVFERADALMYEKKQELKSKGALSR